MGRAPHGDAERDGPRTAKMAIQSADAGFGFYSLTQRQATPKASAVTPIATR
uniref:Uncharacterized protein n=1 Tax=Candidatus Kentrum eta TaxID=2126337 RepID=A0A450VCI2_9GAMM|nr:MAG: hypothetical protein BECKH772A_GA0070896_100944 [Candidatus Kentron sp. H]VFJ96647.1 MAG: hypothetical protein BECKH772B_GA0070898_100954 [Candidatus Kentron sp. H]VFK02477.1 MAG: hypothetical protein BECKH772C_GA0070978_100924 [Candidatus Kentron sp. H]